MASEKTDAIVLKTVPWSESSAIVTFLTRDFGRITAVAKGAYRPKGPFESALDLMAVCRIVFLAKSGDVLDLLTEAKLVRRFRSGQQSLINLYAGYYVAELLLATTQANQHIAELYDLTEQTLAGLDRKESAAAWVLRFELHILRILGHLPCLDQCAVCGQKKPDEPTVPFGIEAGGILCDRCVLGQRQVIRVQRETIDFLILESQRGWQHTDPQQANRMLRGEIRGLLQRYLTYSFDRRFLLHSHLEDLAR